MARTPLTEDAGDVARLTPLGIAHLHAARQLITSALTDADRVKFLAVALDDACVALRKIATRGEVPHSIASWAVMIAEDGEATLRRAAS